jgi:hypothetical protein
MQPVSMRHLDNFPMGGKVPERCGSLAPGKKNGVGWGAVGEQAIGP